ncbi:hypothetical protein WJX72_001455 [[Myrmecia] bisecta]|uniref:Uncharacterized protein n=1 Tax=[Myrmecia] bisecta TaxID=41462 RepID=A0AAW1PZA2_9CHLO
MSHGPRGALVEVARVCGILHLDTTVLPCFQRSNGSLGMVVAIKQSADVVAFARRFVLWYNQDKLGKPQWATVAQLGLATWPEVSDPWSQSRADDMEPFMAWYLRSSECNGKAKGTIIFRRLDGTELHHCGTHVYSLETLKGNISRLRKAFAELSRGTDDANLARPLGNPVTKIFRGDFLKTYKKSRLRREQNS